MDEFNNYEVCFRCDGDGVMQVVTGHGDDYKLADSDEPFEVESVCLVCKGRGVIKKRDFVDRATIKSITL